MDTIPVERAFQRMGANVVFTGSSRRHREGVDVREVEGKETFILTYDHPEEVEVVVIDCQPKMKHLLLQVKEKVENFGRNRRVEEMQTKFLCGHDERHWFVSAVRARNVNDALVQLKPEIVQYTEKSKGVKRSKKNKHRNKAWIRQGEWFFIPAPDFAPDARTILCKKEPISRGVGSKPHICEELARRGGSAVYSFGSQILSVEEYTQLQKTRPRDAMGYRMRTVDAEVFVRGKVSHPDHKTIHLNGWHRVILNGEIVSDRVRFLD